MNTLLLFNAAGIYVITGALCALAMLQLKLRYANKRRRIPSYHDRKGGKLYADIKDQQDLQFLNEDIIEAEQETGEKITSRKL